MSKASLAPQAEKPAEPKPVNVFYVWYAELCRRAGMQPLNYVKPARPKNENVLDFVADRIKPEEWIPVLNALRKDTSLHVIAIHSRASCKFLDDIDTKDKIKQLKRRAGSLHTTYICRALVKALTSCLLKSKVLSCLEFDSIPIRTEDMEVLVVALQQNKVLKMLTFKYCNVGAAGCDILCMALRQIPNIEVLNLTGCKLDAGCARSIAKVVKTQQISRYCESWHNSLRYEDPEVNFMAGLRRITLNNNPGIRDDGLTFILDELDDDLWIKALDMQRCGVTEAMAQRLLDVVEYSRSLEIADFRNNQLEPCTLERIFDLLKEKRSFSSVSEYKWCFTATSLNTSVPALPESQSKCSIFYPAGKSKSVPARNIPSVPTTPLLRTKTSSVIGSSIHGSDPTILGMGSARQPEFQRSVTSLHSKLQRETNKRIRMEQENKKLKEELERMRSAYISLESNISIAKERTVKIDALPRKKTAANKSKAKNEPAAPMRAIKPAINVEFVFENGAQPNDAYSILQNLAKNKNNDDAARNEDRQLTEYFEDTIEECAGMRKDGAEPYKQADSDNEGGSQASLIKFMKRMKTSF